MSRVLRKIIIAVLLGGSLLLLAGACGEDALISKFTDARDNRTYDVMNVNGTLWFAEDLKLENKETYSYQQALNACPPGWSLPSKDDWIQVNNHFGGYVYDGQSIGNPVEAYNDMIKGFGAKADAYYWTSTPAWDDAASIRSSIFYFNSFKTAVEYGAIILHADLRCRCVNKGTPQSSDDIVRFKVENELKTFDFYRIDQQPNVGQVDLFLHRKLDDGNELLDRVDIHFQLPTAFIREQDPSVAALYARLNHHFSSLPDPWSGAGSHSLSSDQDFEMTFTFYDGVVVKGTFSGTSFEGDAVSDGAFELKVRQ